MKRLWIACVALACMGHAGAQDKATDFQKLFDELRMERTLLRIATPDSVASDNAVVLDELEKELELHFKRPLTYEEKKQFSAQQVKIFAEPKGDAETASRVFRDQMFRYLSPADMKAAAEMFATPAVQRIAFALAEAQASTLSYMASGVEPPLLATDPTIGLARLQEFSSHDMLQACGKGVAKSSRAGTTLKPGQVDTACRCFLQESLAQIRTATSREEIAIARRKAEVVLDFDIPAIKDTAPACFGTPHP